MSKKFVVDALRKKKRLTGSFLDRMKAKREYINYRFGDRTGQIEMCKDMSGFQLRLYHIKRLRKRSSVNDHCE